MLCPKKKSEQKNKKMAFVRNGSLWYYDLSKKKLNCVFSYAKNKKDYLRDEYDQHDIQIICVRYADF